jgi:hypothetical protein
MTYFYVIWPPTQPNPPPHPSIPNHLFAFLLRKKAVDGKNCKGTLQKPKIGRNDRLS